MNPKRKVQCQSLVTNVALKRYYYILFKIKLVLIFPIILPVMFWISRKLKYSATEIYSVHYWSIQENSIFILNFFQRIYFETLNAYPKIHMYFEIHKHFNNNKINVLKWSSAGAFAVFFSFFTYVAVKWKVYFLCNSNFHVIRNLLFSCSRMILMKWIHRNP